MLRCLKDAAQTNCLHKGTGNKPTRSCSKGGIDCNQDSNLNIDFIAYYLDCRGRYQGRILTADYAPNEGKMNGDLASEKAWGLKNC